MYNCIVKKVLLSGAILLWIVSATYGWNGPCLSLWMPKCGGSSFGQNTCTGTPPLCTGDCPRRCDEGPRHEFCAGLIGTCTERWVVCSSIAYYKCVPALFGPPSCGCEQWGLTGGTCDRSDCT